MHEYNLAIKNMVCYRCVLAVQQITNQLLLPVNTVKLGTVVFNDKLTEYQYQQFKTEIERIGFELMLDQENIIVDKVKQLLILYYEKDNDIRFTISFKEFLEQNFKLNITKLNEIYFKNKGRTIEQLAIDLRIEKVKELLVYNDLSLKEIAFQLNYSSVPYLSKQFKNTVGITPSAFKLKTKINRKSLDEL